MIILNDIKIDDYISVFPNGEYKILVEDLMEDLYEPEKFKELKAKSFIYEWKPFEGKMSHLEELIVLDWLKKSIKDNLPNELHVYHLPYSRMDRETGGQMFTLEYVAKMINDMEFNRVYICDCHSAVGMDLINYSEESVNAVSIFRRFYYGDDSLLKNTRYILFPDEGALKRYEMELPHFEMRGQHELTFLIGEKKRNPNTGEIESLEMKTLEGEEIESLDNEKGLCIIDDLCSYGGTFYKASEILRGKYGFTGEINLVVTHLEINILKGIESNRKENNFINRIFCSNSILSQENIEEIEKFCLTNKEKIYIEKIV